MNEQKVVMEIIPRITAVTSLSVTGHLDDDTIT